MFKIKKVQKTAKQFLYKKYQMELEKNYTPFIHDIYYFIFYIKIHD